MIAPRSGAPPGSAAPASPEVASRVINLFRKIRPPGKADYNLTPHESRILKLLVEGIPIYPRSVTIINDELGEDFMRSMGGKNACLLLGHGMTTAGASVEDATLITLNVFELARLNYMAYAIGNPKPIPEADIQEYSRRWRNRVPKSEDSKGEHPDWRYFVKLLSKK